MAFARVLVRLCLVKASIRPHSTPLPTPVRPRDAFSAFQDLPQPRSVAATPRTDLSNATEPCILTGLVNAFEGIPDDLLTNTGGKVRVDVWPVDGGPCPAKAGGVIIGPTLVPVAADRVLPLLREKQRGYHAYIRHLDLNSFLDVAARLPLKRARQLCGPRIKSANLWLGDGRVRSAVHWDGHDNLLIQLEGRKTVLLLPPDAVAVLGFRRFRYHAWRLSEDELEAIGRGTCLSPAFSDHEHCKADVENHCTFDAFLETATLPPAILRRAYVAVLEPGQALFVPAL